MTRPKENTKIDDPWGVSRWGQGYFVINALGHLEVHVDDRVLDLKILVDELIQRGIDPPVLIRVLDILGHRVRHLNTCFANAVREYGYKAHYQGVYPLKVNPQKRVVEYILEAGRSFHTGLEVGSKPELLAAAALMDDPEALIVCNGYKDQAYVEAALLARKLKHNTVLVLDRPGELPLVLRAVKRLGIKPALGVRAKLSATGAGRWNESTGSRAKFGLTVPEILRVLEILEADGLLDCLVLLHFHIGSQINDSIALKRSLREASRLYVALRNHGCNVRYLDVGGGLGVDYIGTMSGTADSSCNYSDQEYANDVVYWVGEVCDQAGVPAPILVSESGRAMVAHHLLLIFDVLGVNDREHNRPLTSSEDVPRVVKQLLDLRDAVRPENAVESYADLLHLRNDYSSLFNHGLLDLKNRAWAEELFWMCCLNIRDQLRPEDASRPELLRLAIELADVYYCNFSLFQSLPDIWAVDQIFPIAPVHRLTEPPARRGVLADLTCDSDGIIDRFPGENNVERTLPLHALKKGEDYHVGAFLIGAYQESLGDLHNLFGDTHVVHVLMAEAGGYQIERVVEGESIADVLRYAGFSDKSLMARLRQKVDAAVLGGQMELTQSRGFLNSHQEMLRGYSFLDRRGSGE